MTAREPALPPVRVDDRTRDLQLLVTAREKLVAETTRVRNALDAHLVVLLPGYQTLAPNLVAARPRAAVRVRLRGREGVQVKERTDRRLLGGIRRQPDVRRLTSLYTQFIVGGHERSSRRPRPASRRAAPWL